MEAATARPHVSIAGERSRIEGALDLLDLLREDLILRRDQARDASGREAYDEVLTQVDALVVEYRRRSDALPPVSPHHASYAFLLGAQGEVHPLPHRVYVALVRGEAAVPEFAGHTLRLAEWYVRLEAEAPDAVVNETYVPLAIDSAGRADWSATPGAGHEDAAWPSAAERARMQALLFGDGATPGREAG